MTREEVIVEFKNHLIQYLNLLDTTPEQINNEEPLFGGDLGLDSIDSVELIVIFIKQHFTINMVLKSKTQQREDKY